VSTSENQSSGQSSNNHPPGHSNQILCLDSTKVNLVTHSRQYGLIAELMPTDTNNSPPISSGPLKIPWPKVDLPPKVPKIPLRHTAQNSHARATHQYSIVDDLAQSPTAMSSLEVLQTCPSQRKALLSSLGFVDPSDDRMITFYIDNTTPHLPPSVAFQILVTIKNVIVHRCIIDEGASTCVMSANVWKTLWSPELVPSTITLRAYDGHPSQP